jgi:hypothetical protein
MSLDQRLRKFNCGASQHRRHSHQKYNANGGRFRVYDGNYWRLEGSSSAREARATMFVTYITVALPPSTIPASSGGELCHDLNGTASAHSRCEAAPLA